MSQLRMMKFGARIGWALEVTRPGSQDSMVTKSTDRILEILGVFVMASPPRSVAGRLDATASNISSRLSKLAAYGIIIKTRGRVAHDASPLALYSCAVYGCAVYNAPLASTAVAPCEVVHRTARPKKSPHQNSPQNESSAQSAPRHGRRDRQLPTAAPASRSSASPALRIPSHRLLIASASFLESMVAIRRWRSLCAHHLPCLGGTSVRPRERCHENHLLIPVCG